MVAYVNDEDKVNFDLTVPLSRIMTQPVVTSMSYETAYAAQIGQVKFLYFQPPRYSDGIQDGENMRLYAKKTFEFSLYETRDGVKAVSNKFVVKAGLDNIVDAPDWIANDPLFAWAKADGDIHVFESATDIKKVEKEATTSRKKQVTNMFPENVFPNVNPNGTSVDVIGIVSVASIS